MSTTELPSADEKLYLIDCVTTKNAFHLIQSIPSKRAEPFKRWLAQVGYERMREIEDLSLAYEWMVRLYKEKRIPC